MTETAQIITRPMFGVRRPVRNVRRQLKPPRMDRFENRHAARIFSILETVEDLLKIELFPNLDTIVAEQRETDALVVQMLTMDDAGERIARHMGRIEVFVEQTIPDPRVEQLAERTAREVNDVNGEFAKENIRSVLGVDPFVSEPWLTGEIEHFANENASLIKGLAREQVADIEQMIFRQVRAGAGTRAIIAEIQEIIDAGKSRARLIARDQIGKFNGRLTQLRQRQIGITEYTWQTSEDERVRPDHARLDQTVQQWDSPPVTVTKGKRAGERNHPGMDIQCIPADSNVRAIQGAIKLFRRAYRGKLTELVADDGSTVTATPHHPVFTASGWKPIKQVQVGEKIFKASRQTGLIRENNIQQIDISIGDVFDAAAKVFPPPMREAGIAGQFHGDGTDQEVHIVNTNGLLPSETEAPLNKDICEEILTRADERINDSFLYEGGPPEFALMALWPTTDSIMRGARKLHSLFTTQLTHAEQHRITASAWLNPILHKAIADDRAAHSIFFGDSLLAFPGKIVGDDLFAIHLLSIVRGATAASGGIDSPMAEQLAESVRAATDQKSSILESAAIGQQPLRVVDRFSLDHDGPVFNVETPNGWYFTGNYILKNCRCIAEAIFPEVT